MSFEIVGSVEPNEVPALSHQRRASQWEALAARVLEDHKAGRVTVIKTKDEKDISRIRHNVQNHLHKDGLSASPVVVRGDGGEIRVFIEVITYRPQKSRQKAE